MTKAKSPQEEKIRVLNRTLKQARSLVAAGDAAGAKACFQSLLRKDPRCAPALNGLGLLAADRSEMDLAISYFKRAAAADPKAIDPLLNLADVHLARSEPEAASLPIERALRIDPSRPKAHRRQGRALRAQGRHAEARVSFARAYALDPSLLEDLITCSLEICVWDDLERLAQELLEKNKAGENNNIYALGLTGASMADLGLCARNLAVFHEAWSAKQTPLPAPPARHDLKIRIGYLSGDFHDHPTTQLIIEVLEFHDRSRFEVHGFSYGPSDMTPRRQRLIDACDRFHDLRALSSWEAAAAIRAAGIDILIDLKGYTYESRPQIVALRPAPIQVNYLGFPGTMGADFIDYVIADEVVCPFDFQPDVRERIVHLPFCFQPNSKRPSADATPDRLAAGLPAEGFVFCSFNTTFKLNPETLDQWSQILRQVEGGVLWLYDNGGPVSVNLRREAAKRGIDPQRLIFAPRLPLVDHLARLSLADLCLDTLPAGAFTTASDALWRGAPILTLLGPTPAGRGAASLLHALGLDALITTSPTEYIAAAVRLAKDPEALRALRNAVSAAVETSPVFDCRQFVPGLERAFTQMQALHTSGQKPVAFSVSAHG